MKRKRYVNDKQAKILAAKQIYRTAIIGRGGGKTHELGHEWYNDIKHLPEDKGYILNKSFGQAYTKTVPEILDVLKEEYGLKEHISNKKPGHFVICKKPPIWWPKPRKSPEQYSNVITFITGHIKEILSFDRPDLNRGGSYGCGDIDEAALIKWDQFEKTILPLTRGKVSKNDHPRRFRTNIMTSRAWKASGKWTESKMKQLASDRPHEFFYIEASARDNIHVLGENYFDRMKAIMDPITYAVEIENKPVSKLPNAYYQDLDDEIHLYDPEFDYQYDENELIPYKISAEKDVDPSLPIEPSFDFNAAFTSATIWQDRRPEEMELRCLRNFFVKYKTIEDLVDLICDHYKFHPTKIANIYGGKDGYTKFKLHNDNTLYERIITKFKQRGWQAHLCVEVSLADVAHKQKHLVMNNVLREVDPSLPCVRFNEQNAKQTFMSMTFAPVKGDFQKDKASESDEDLAQEDATHLSDTVDNYVYPKVLRNFQNQSKNTSTDSSLWQVSSQ